VTNQLIEGLQGLWITIQTARRGLFSRLAVQTVPLGEILSQRQAALGADHA
jgi:hypothetical protein